MATVRLDQKKRALVRSIPSSYTKALARFFGTGPTDVDLARRQQQHYIDTLEANGVSVHRLDADENHPDCMFVEDQAVVIDGHVLLPVPGHPSRVGEQPPVADFLVRQLHGGRLCRMDGDARMDGGDVALWLAALELGAYTVVASVMSVWGVARVSAVTSEILASTIHVFVPLQVSAPSH